MIQSFYCFLCTWISFPSLYLENNWLISFFVECSAKSSLCLKLMPRPLGKSNRKVFGSVFITNTPIIIMTWLNCFKVFWWFYCVDTKYIVCVWFFFFLVCMNYFQQEKYIGILVDSFLGNKIFNSFLSVTSYSSPSSSCGMGFTSTNSSHHLLVMSWTL